MRKVVVLALLASSLSGCANQKHVQSPGMTSVMKAMHRLETTNKPSPKQHPWKLPSLHSLGT